MKRPIIPIISILGLEGGGAVNIIQLLAPNVVDNINRGSETEYLFLALLLFLDFSIFDL